MVNGIEHVAVVSKDTAALKENTLNFLHYHEARSEAAPTLFLSNSALYPYHILPM